MNEKAVIPEDLQGVYEAAKWRVEDHGSPGAQWKIAIIERVAALQAEVDALKKEVARLSAPVTDAEWRINIWPREGG